MLSICVSGEDSKLLFTNSAANSHLPVLCASCNATITCSSVSNLATASQNFSGFDSFNSFILMSSGFIINSLALIASLFTFCICCARATFWVTSLWLTVVSDIISLLISNSFKIYALSSGSKSCLCNLLDNLIISSVCFNMWSPWANISAANILSFFALDLINLTNLSESKFNVSAIFIVSALVTVSVLILPCAYAVSAICFKRIAFFFGLYLV